MNMSVSKCCNGGYSVCKLAAILSIIIIVSFAVPTLSGADQWHYKNLIVGDRAAGMGGAYTAVSDTPEGTYYNPAGIVYAVGRSLSASANAFHNTETTYRGVLAGGNWTRKSSSLVPNFFGMVQPLGKGKIAFSYAVSDIIEEDQNQVFRDIGNIDSFTINLSNLEKTYKIGPSYALKVNDSLSIGATVYLHYRQEKLVFSQFFLMKDGTFEWSNLNVRRTEYGVEPKIGVIWSPADKFSLGLTVAKTEIFDSDTRTQNTAKTDISPSQVTVTSEPSVVNSSSERDYPLSVSLGGAWFPSESLIVSCDVDYFESVSSENKESVVNVSLGVEYYLSEKHAVRGGFYTDMANTPDLRSGDKNQDDHIDIYGVTGSFTRFTRSSALTVGFNYAYGVGDAQPVVGTTNIYDAKFQAITIFLSGSYSY